ncbi:MAG: hypothetical protein AB7Q97_06410 [Gammaproteobacteria bacterium]
MDVIEFDFDDTLTAALLQLRRAVQGEPPIHAAARDATTAYLLSRAHPFFGRPGNRHRRFAIARGAGIAAHALAFVNAAMRDDAGAPVGAIGCFECQDDGDAARRVLDSASDWLRANAGVRRILAPLDFDIWHDHRLMTRGFAAPAFIGEPRNPAWYPGLLAGAGFRPYRRWDSVEVPGSDALAAIMARHAGKAQAAHRAGYRFAPMDPNRSADVRALHAAVTTAFSGFPAFTACSFEDYAAQTRGYAAIVDFRHALLLRSSDGAVAGFAVAFADAAPSAPGAPLDEPGRQAIERSRAPGSRFVFHSIGVLPSAGTGHGLGGALVHETLAGLLRAGAQCVIFALMAQEGPGRRLLGPAALHAQREYVLFEREA